MYIQRAKDPHQDHQDQKNNDENRIAMYARIRYGLHVLKSGQGWSVVRFKFQDVSKVQSGFLIVTVSFQYFTELKMLHPCILIGRLNL